MINECNKKKNAVQCKEKFNEKLEKIKTQIQLHQDNVRIYTKQADVEKREKLMKQAAKEEKKRMKKETNL
jgi:ribosomal protein L24